VVRQWPPGSKVPRLYRTDSDVGLDGDGAVDDHALVEQAWTALHQEQAFADRLISRGPTTWASSSDTKVAPILGARGSCT